MGGVTTGVSTVQRQKPRAQVNAELLRVCRRCVQREEGRSEQLRLKVQRLTG